MLYVTNNVIVIILKGRQLVYIIITTAHHINNIYYNCIVSYLEDFMHDLTIKQCCTITEMLNHDSRLLSLLSIKVYQ